jgi:hypothetical protein
VVPVAAAATEAFWDQEEASAAGNILPGAGSDRTAAAAVGRHLAAGHRDHIDAAWVAFLGEGPVVGRGKVCPHEVAEECIQEGIELGRDGLLVVLVLVVDIVAAVGTGKGIAVVAGNQ